MDKSVFEPTPRTKHPDPALRGDKITGDRYYSKEFMQKEWDHVWTKVWQIAGIASEIPEPDDFFVYKIGIEEILIVRQEDLTIKAFYNVCPHRGNILVHVEKGFLEKFKCTYHGWTYNTEGVLVDLQDAEDFDGGNPCGKIKLKEVKCEIGLGFVWINLDNNCQKFEEALYPILEHMKPYQPEKFVRVLNMTCEVDCNWKIIHDNFNESYHLPTLHPELSVHIENDYKFSQFDMYDNGHNRMLMPGHKPALGDQSPNEVQFPLDAALKAWDLNPEDFKGKAQETRLAIQKQKKKLSKERGFWHYEFLTDEQLTDYYFYNCFPNYDITMTPDGIQFQRPQPHPTDPEKCLFEHWWLVPEMESLSGSATFMGSDTTEVTAGEKMTETPLGPRPLKPADHEWVVYPEGSMGFVTDQDISMAIGQQKGVKSKGFEDAILTNQERRVRRYHEVLNDYIEGRR
ncbi:MAG: aromatic ring-hydroxylating dioxygenase subunit alpha [Hyphomicrobiales bacterium]|nr:aromatic ring-hydroxylating dioxygenase subunit alpha [Hyphomicrobiales bacterium]